MDELEDRSILQSDNIAYSEAKHAKELNPPECSVDSLSPSFEESNIFEAKIRGLEELIQNLGEQKLEMIMKLDELMFERDKAIPWEYLYYREAKYNMANRWQEIDIFKLILEKLSGSDFERPISSCSLSNQDVYKQKLHFRVLHGTSSLAEENKLFRRNKTSQIKKEEDPSDWLHRRMRCHRKRPEDRVKEIEHEWNRKESVAEAIAQGKIRNSLSSNRRDIRHHIKVMNEEFVELKKEHVRSMQSAACEERKMKARDKEICALTKQLDSIRPRKERLQRCVSELRKELVRVNLNSN